MRKDLQACDWLVPFFYDTDQSRTEYLDGDQVAACELVQTVDDALIAFNHGMVTVRHPKYGIGYILSMDLEDA